MCVYSLTDSTREVTCKKYIEILCEYIGGPKYWNGHCDCTPISTDSVIESLQSQIIKLNMDIVTNNWNYEIINLINDKLKQLIDKKFMDLRNYGVCNEIFKNGKHNEYIYIKNILRKKI
ncbi:hypothetical protein [Paraclostridium sordellii]|uniref:hypothetical protein n=1 Tax=Paraclostridium sordellii TaxID=1505 RepID=UPI0005E9C3A1|nr:hypothetical protein [Paeniclostridium sordellii]MDU6247344.1 hypothetical protein [Paeniclostridium sordellii]CEN26439.1 Uncharacterised protein [[Clostridium] sordellii] [Paeniclostridium sordellii]